MYMFSCEVQEMPKPDFTLKLSVKSGDVAVFGIREYSSHVTAYQGPFILVRHV
jgi:hypothetical protein